MVRTLILFLLYIFPAQAQTPTVVYGAAETAGGKENQFMVVQPEDAPNPLGNPIITVPDTVPAAQTSQQPLSAVPETKPSQTAPSDIINQTAEQNPAPFSETPQEEQNQIQNTLYQSGDRIYDVQSFPLNDIKTITEPNIQPTITTYPEY